MHIVGSIPFSYLYPLNKLSVKQYKAVPIYIVGFIFGLTFLHQPKQNGFLGAFQKWRHHGLPNMLDRPPLSSGPVITFSF